MSQKKIKLCEDRVWRVQGRQVTQKLKKENNRTKSTECRDSSTRRQQSVESLQRVYRTSVCSVLRVSAYREHPWLEIRERTASTKNTAL